mmetsp:Transcript_3512/g.4725  ORF Transcript_3512/g.4725 Transcript_3512/m.4725 type:complete len:438 (+) Transcript_3512:232-1545(+)
MAGETYSYVSLGSFSKISCVITVAAILLFRFIYFYLSDSDGSPIVETDVELVSLFGKQNRLNEKRLRCADHPFSNPKPVFTKSAKIQFLSVGDWGLDLSPHTDHDDGSRDDWSVRTVKGISHEMEKVASQFRDSSFVLNVGDNFYQYGIDDINDERWDTSFEDVFNGKRLSELTWYSTLGNHDWKGNLNYNLPDMNTHSTLDHKGVMAQILRTFHHRNKRWCMPGFNYTILVNGRTPKSVGVRVRIVVFDSQSLVQVNPDKESGAYDHKYVPQKRKVIEWLRQALCSNVHSDEWLITVSHHFFYTVGNYYPPEERLPPTMEKEVLPILQECGVHAHFHGHDHVTQILEIMPRSENKNPVNRNRGILQIGVGSGGKTNGNVRGDQSGLDEALGSGNVKLKYASSTAAFALVTVTPKTLSLELINYNGEYPFDITVSRE